MIRTLEIVTAKQGLHEVTEAVSRVVSEAGLTEGLCTVFVQHTSASLIVQENADPSARDDLERWLNRLVPEGDPIYRHTLEGADDMPAHVKATLTATSLVIPVMDNRLSLGTWQGIYLWEHRHQAGRRRLVIHLA